MDSLRQEIELGLERLNDQGLQEVLHQIRLLQHVPRLQSNHNVQMYMSTGEYLDYLNLSNDRMKLLIDFAIALKQLSQDKVDKLTAEKKARKAGK